MQQRAGFLLWFLEDLERSSAALTHLERRCVGAGRPRLLRGQASLFPPAGRHLGLLGLGRLRVDRLEQLRTETDAARVSAEVT